MLSSLASAAEVQTVRLWRRLWPLQWGKDIPERLLSRALNMGLLKPIWFEFQPGLWMKLDIRDVVQGTLIAGEPWERKTTEFITATLTPGQVFLDIGANAGYFTLLASRCVGASGMVLAVEPNPAMAAQLRQNVTRSRLTNVVVEAVACSDTTVTHTLYLGNPHNTGVSSLCNTNLTWTESVDVNCTTADLLVGKHAVPRVDLVKIDVEGAELQVLRGMTTILTRLRPKIVIELLPSLLGGFSATVEDVTEYLTRVGYSISPLGEHSNYLCTPS